MACRRQKTKGAGWRAEMECMRIWSGIKKSWCKQYWKPRYRMKAPRLWKEKLNVRPLQSSKVRRIRSKSGREATDGKAGWKPGPWGIPETKLKKEFRRRQIIYVKCSWEINWEQQDDTATMWSLSVTVGGSAQGPTWSSRLKTGRGIWRSDYR